MTPDAGQDYALYLRKSNGRKPIPRQRSLTTAHVQGLGGRVAAEFADADSTAFRKTGGPAPDRKGFERMLVMLAASPGLGVAAWHADRLTRSPEDTEALIRVCAAGRNPVETYSGGRYDLWTATGRRRLRDDTTAAAYEVDHNTERVLAGRAEVAAQGRWLGGRRPFGWEPDPVPLGKDGKPMLDEDGKLVKGILKLVPREAQALARACEAVVSGATLASVARDWNAAGILTTGGARWRPREVGRVLLRPRNAGLMEHQGQVSGGAQWKAAVDETTWRGAVAVLSDPARRTTPGPAARHLLSWIARCGTCGGPMIVTSTSRAGRPGSRRLVYRCRDDARGHMCRDARHLEQYVTAAVIAYLGRRDVREVMTPPQDGTLARLYAEKAAVEDRMTQRDRLHRQRIITDQMLIDGLADLRAELSVIEEKIAAAAQADVLAPLAGDPAGAWEGMSLDRRRAVISRLVTVTVLPAPRGRPAGWQPGEPYSVPGPETVRIEWRQ